MAVRDLATAAGWWPGSVYRLDVLYDATVRVASDGTMVKRLRYVTDTGSESVDCEFDAAWSADEDTVLVDVPHRCLDFGGFVERHWFQATMYRGSASDAARASTWDAATPRVVHRGRDAGRRRGRQEVPGARASGHRGGVRRRRGGQLRATYTDCDGGDRWFVQYSMSDNTVVNTGRV